MIERGHEHLFISYDDLVLPDGTRRIWARCVCELEERRLFHADGSPNRVEYRFGRVWMNALELLRLLPIRVAVCPTCQGDPDPRTPRCETCLAAGVVDLDTGEPVKPILPAAMSDPEPNPAPTSD